MAKEERQIKKEKMGEILDEVSTIKRKLSALEGFIQPPQELSKNYAAGWIKGLKEDLDEIDSSIRDLMEMESS